MKKKKPFILTNIYTKYNFLDQKRYTLHENYLTTNNYSNKNEATSYFQNYLSELGLDVAKYIIQNDVCEIIKEYENFYFIKYSDFSFLFISKINKNKVYLDNENIKININPIDTYETFKDIFNKKLKISKKDFFSEIEFFNILENLKILYKKNETKINKYYETLNKEKNHREGYVLTNKINTEATNVVYNKTYDQSFKHFKKLKKLENVEDSKIKDRIFKCYILGNCDLYISKINNENLMIFRKNSFGRGRFKTINLCYEDELENTSYREIENHFNMSQFSRKTNEILKIKDKIFMKFMLNSKLKSLLKKNNIDFKQSNYKKIKKCFEKS